MSDATGTSRVGRVAIWVAGLALFGILTAVGLRGLRTRDAERDAFPLVDGTLATPAVERPVTVFRDPRGVPHVEAASERDAFATLGFVHAQDRLGQMLWLRQRARGRAAEVLGQNAVDADRMARTLGFTQLASEQLPRLAPEVRRVLTAYAGGVNARIARIAAGEAAAPVWVVRLGLPLDPWRPEDSLAVFKLHAWGLGASVESVLVLDQMIQRLGPAEAGRFFPGGGLGEALPVPDAVVRHMRSERRGRSGKPAGPTGPAGALRRALHFDGMPAGSSAWVLGGAHTESGWPIVASDHHLPTSLPAWFHLDHLRGGALDVAGATLPGVPVFFSGRNRRVAWGAVSAGAVVTDLYKERLSRRQPGRYHDGRRWRDLAKRVEQIEVRGSDPLVYEVLATRNGPLLPGRGSGGESSDPVSVSWTGARIQGPSGIASLLGVARAEDAEQLVAALEAHHEPVLAVVYADSEGAAGMQVAGWIPLRSLSAQLALLEGRAARYQWSEPVAFDALPSVQLPDGEGFVVAADASLAARARARIDWLWHGSARASRIESLLRQAAREGAVDIRRISELQNDAVDARVRRVVLSIETLVDAIDEPLGPQAGELLRLLTDWDGTASRDSQGAAAYHVMIDSLATALFAPSVGEDLWRRYLALPRTDAEALLGELLASAASDAAAGGEYAEGVSRILRDTLRETWLRLSFEMGPNRDRWTWGRLHPIRFRPFAGLDAVLGDEQLPTHPYPGTANTLRAGPFDPLKPFEVSMASTVRFAFDAGSLDQSLAILAPGQSEHPGHPHFDDQLRAWLEGRAGLLATGPLVVEETSVARLRLEPVP